MDGRGPAQRFQDLIVWQKAHGLTLAVYRVSGGFPRTEVYGLTSQMRRAAVSVPANIAEGFKKRSKLDKARFLNIAQASLEELRYYLILSADLGYPAGATLPTASDEVARLLDAYLRRLQDDRRGS